MPATARPTQAHSHAGGQAGAKPKLYNPRHPERTLIDTVVGGRLCCQIPIRLNVHPVIHLRITILPQRESTRRGYVWWLGFHPDVIENLPDLRALGEERNQAYPALRIALLSAASLVTPELIAGCAYSTVAAARFGLQKPLALSK